jgi:hypothetical protein
LKKAQSCCCRPQAEPVLEPLILTGKGTVARAAAVEALAMLCFVGSEGTLDTLHTMQTLWCVVVGGEGGRCCCWSCCRIAAAVALSSAAADADY